MVFFLLRLGWFWNGLEYGSDTYHYAYMTDLIFLRTVLVATVTSLPAECERFEMANGSRKKKPNVSVGNSIMLQLQCCRQTRWSSKKKKRCFYFTEVDLETGLVSASYLTCS